MADFDQKSSDTALGGTQEMLRVFVTLTFFQGHQGQITMEKFSLYSYLLNQRPDFDQTGRYIIGRTVRND